MIKIDHVHSGAEMSAVYLPANKRMQGKQMTAVTGGIIMHRLQMLGSAAAREALRILAGR